MQLDIVFACLFKKHSVRGGLYISHDVTSL